LTFRQIAGCLLSCKPPRKPNVWRKRIIQRAADLQGRTITDFVIASLDRSARETVREHEVMKLNVEDSLRLAKALINPPAPNAALRRAMALHKKTVTMR